MYSTKFGERVEEFGTSGFLYRSNKLMYDRTTNSLWNQFTGEPAVGTLVGQEIKLEILPVVVTTWGEWVQAHPDTSVLDLNTGLYRPEEYPPEWETWSIYYPYRTSPDTMFPVWRQSDRLATKGRVFGLVIDGDARAYPLDLLAENPVLNDRLGGEAVVLVSSGHSRGVRAYRRDANLFSINGGGGATGGISMLLDQQGRSWRVEEEALVLLQDPDQRLPRLPSQNAYWFGWYAFYPNTDIYGSDTAP